MDLLKRAKERTQQTIQEKMGSAQKTEYDADLAAHLQAADDMRAHSEKVLAALDGFLRPEPAFIAGLKMDSQNKSEAVALTMTHFADALAKWPVADDYKNAMLVGGEKFTQLGDAERQFLEKANKLYVEPVKQFLNGDVKLFAQDRKELDTRRLDMDALKNKAEKAPTNAAVAGDLERATKAFDEQRNTVIGRVDALKAQLPTLRDHLKQLVKARADYMAQSQNILTELSDAL